MNLSLVSRHSIGCKRHAARVLKGLLAFSGHVFASVGHRSLVPQKTMRGMLKHTLRSTAFYTCVPSRNSSRNLLCIYSRCKSSGFLVQNGISNFKMKSPNSLIARASIYVRCIHSFVYCWFELSCSSSASLVQSHNILSSDICLAGKLCAVTVIEN